MVNIYLPILRINFKKKNKDQQRTLVSNDAYAMLLCFFFLIFFIKAYVVFI